MQTDNSILGKLNGYNLKVNEDMIRHLMESAPENDRIHLLMSHIVIAHQIWLERMGGKSMSAKPFDLFPYENLIGRNRDNHELTSKFISERDLDEKIRYVNIKRQRFENSISDMFLHLFNHSSYHRGQINQLLVQEGKNPMVADYIVYNRTEIL